MGKYTKGREIREPKRSMFVPSRPPLISLRQFALGLLLGAAGTITLSAAYPEGGVFAGLQLKQAVLLQEHESGLWAIEVLAEMPSVHRVTALGSDWIEVGMFLGNELLKTRRIPREAVRSVTFVYSR
jgi:hypothetical protein